MSSLLFLTLTLALHLSFIKAEILGEVRETQQIFENDSFRNQIVRNAEKTINEHNSKPERTFQMGMTRFVEYTQEEFLNEMAGGCVQSQESELQEIRFDSIMGPHKEVDWRDEGIAKNVKDQGNNPTSAVFAAVGAIEGAMNIKNRGVTITLSEQQVIDCSTQLTICPSGTVEQSLKYAKSNPVQKEEDYFYTGQRKECKADYAKAIVELEDICTVHSSEDQVMEAVSRQPVPFCFDAKDLQYYVSGIIQSSSCSQTEVNYCALLVGYNKNEWIAKASFGEAWGEKGYFRLKKGSNTCGMLNHVYFPTL